MLKNIEYDTDYCSIDCDLDVEFFIPSYRESRKLSRGSGYFTLRSLILDIDGIVSFLDNGGDIRLVCNPELSEDDIAVIDAGLSLSPEAITKDLLRELTKDQFFSERDLDALDIICNMISERRLEIKVAFMPRGKYHEKNGVFEDAAGNKVCYTGSLNETKGGKRDNYEQIEVFTSWEGGAKRIAKKETRFEDLWNNRRGERIVVFDFPTVLRDKMFSSYKQSERLSTAVSKFKSHSTPTSGSTKSLYPYQEDAIKEFVQNGYAHFYEMATGTGKTFTSIRTISRFIQDKQRAFVVICVPQIDLQEQWEDSLREEGYDNLFFAGGVVSKRPGRTFTDAIITYSIDLDSVICIAVYDTFFDKVYNQLDNLENLFIIVDEAHNLNPSQVEKLPTRTPYRLGLSATAERFQKSETTLFLNYFTGGTIKPYYYGIEEAIDNHFLSHYVYTPIFVFFSEDKFDTYKKKSQQIAVLRSLEDRDEEQLSRLRRERGLLVKQEPNKLIKLQELTKSYDFTNSVVYCGQGKDGEVSIINLASGIIHDAGYRVHHYTSKTEDRTAVKKLFTENYYDTLIAIKCLDEGVDIPKLDKIYIMASDSSLRQTVQRRGRVLRICKNTGKDIAYIYDMVMLPPEGVFDGAGVISLLVTEFSRVREYNRLANNKDENDVVIDRLLQQYNITQEDFNNEQESI